jgi:hypothetical protein
MDSEIIKAIAELIEVIEKDLQLDNGLIKCKSAGHTSETAALEYCHDGRATSIYYAMCIAIGAMEEKTGCDILKALQTLQVTDSESPQFGGFRWYGEETRINDTNAAFFILMPLAVVRLLYYRNIPSTHSPLIDEILRMGMEWFYKECTHPVLYYTNKVLSDGAMFLAISSLINNDEYYRAAVGLFEQWEDYTHRRGWGWGENISLTYQNVILNSLQLACCALRPEETQIKQKLQSRMNELIEILKFHEGYEFVPTIRSYNSDGRIQRKSLLWLVAGIKENILAQINIHDADFIKELWACITLIVLHEQIFQGMKKAAINEPGAMNPIPRIRMERVFEDAYSYSWIGQYGRVGSLNRFPVISGCYQWPTWGLGWQSYPVGFGVNDSQFSYLRWVVKEGENVRMHPGMFKKNYLNPALFKESHYPEVETRCSQNQNALLVLRSLSGVHNQVSELYDEWVIPRFNGSVEFYCSKNAANPRKWVILSYENASVAFSALKGIPSNETKRSDMHVSVEQKETELCLRQWLYRGNETVLQHPRMEAGWALLFIDEPVDMHGAEKILDCVEITDDLYQDFEVPRLPYTEVRKIHMSMNLTIAVSLCVDPAAH